jgi:hypothetical protein
VRYSKINEPMSALGQKRTSRRILVMSALPPKADIRQCGLDVCFVPKADMTSRVECIFRQNSHLTKVVGAARGDQDAGDRSSAVI